MNRPIWLLLFISLVLVASVSTAEAARTIPASNETSTLNVYVAAYSDGGLRSRTDMALCQGNGDLRDNPPLNGTTGEGVNCIVYQEHTMATSGVIGYVKEVNVDTGNQELGGTNLDTTRIIDFSASSDGTAIGTMISTESTTVTSTATAANASECCMLGAEEGATVSATSDHVMAGSAVNLHEGQVTSTSSATTIAAAVDVVPVAMSYNVEINASAQTGEAQGTATAYVDAALMEGIGEGTAQSTGMDYDQSTTVRGDMISLAMEVSFESGEGIH